jgi:hypothetical protein
MFDMCWNMFCIHIDGSAVSLEVFNIINHFLEENEINCTNGVQSISAQNAGLQALVRKKASHIIWTQCMLHRQALSSRVKS